jgi:N-acetylneuraminic acid mutarotase
MFASRVNRLLISALVAVLFLAGCKGHSGTAAPVLADTNWTWEAGSNAANYIGNYISVGSATSTGQPSGRYSAMSWLDSSGQFWVFSGAGGASDMWMFNTSTLQWTWVAGNASVTVASTGIYGTQGIAAPTNLPGQRSAGSTWIDSSGNFWMFGGYGTDANGLIGYLSDLWSFNPSTKWWTWQKGPASGNGSVDWGTLNVPASTNQPNPRSNAAQWTAGGKFYMFGGEGYLTGNQVVQNDMWEFDPSTTTWTWIGGTQSLNPIGTYGAQGKVVASNQPGGRQSATTWTDSSGNFWMFGGTGIDYIGNNGQLNDLWQYNPTSKQWVWMNGSVQANFIGSYGTNAVPSTLNQPGGRSGGIGWVDNSGNLWLFGGYGINTLGNQVVLNDLWEYQMATQQWIWVNGSYYGDATGIYNSIGVLSEYNSPGSRLGSSAWKDSSGNFWMFAGEGYDAAGTDGRLSDTWRFIP